MFLGPVIHVICVFVLVPYKLCLFMFSLYLRYFVPVNFCYHNDILIKLNSHFIFHNITIILLLLLLLHFIIKFSVHINHD